MVVVVLYLAQISHLKSSQRQGKVAVLKFVHDVGAGKKPKRVDVEIVEIERSQLKHLESLVKAKDIGDVVGRRLYEEGRIGQFVQFHHIMGQDRYGPSSKLYEGMVAVPLDVDPRYVPGDILRVYDRVNILAVLSVDRKPHRTYRVMEYVRVLAVGGRGEQQRYLVDARGARKGQMPRTYRSITVEVPKDKSLELMNVLTHRIGAIRLELCRSGKNAEIDESKIGRINPELKKLAQKAAMYVGDRPIR